MKRKKLSIFTSVITPYGLRMKAAIAPADMEETAHRKNPSRTYFSPRSGMSSQRGARRFLLKTFLPARHRYSEIVPTGHSHEQNALRNRNEMATKVTSRNIAAGCIAGTLPVS